VARQAPPSRAQTRRPVRVLALLIFIVVVALEGLALIRAEQFRGQIPALEISDLDHARTEYRRIAAWTPLGLGSARVDRLLTDRMLNLANRTIFEYRADTPAVAKAQWEQARECLDLATEISPADAEVAGKRAYVRGQLARIADRNDEAIRLFRDASRLIPTQPDPYLGLATVFAYVTHDLDGFTQAISDAGQRGYVSGRRVRVWSGDLHLKLGEQAETEAKKLNGAERIEQLERAAADYGKCIESFDGVRLFNSDRNLRTCRRRLAEISKQLPPPQTIPPDNGDPLRRL